VILKSYLFIVLYALGFAFAFLTFYDRITDTSLRGKDVENYRRVVSMGKVRGRFVDPSGKYLTDIEVGYTVFQLMTKGNEYLRERERMEKLLGKPINFREYRYMGFSEIMGLSEEDVYLLMRNKYRFRTLLFIPKVKRKLVCKGCWHIIGSVSADGVGLGGLEALYDNVIGGKMGNVVFESDALGRVLSEPEIYINVMPSDITVSLRYDLYLLADSLFKDERGAIFAFNPQNGFVYLSYSKPSPLDTNDPTLSPLLNRALSGLYPPGSTLKPLIALLALKDGIIDTNFAISCKGAIYLGRRVFRCWSVHGYTKLEKAIAQSCNVYFYNIGGRYGAKEILNSLKGTGLFGRKFTNLKEEVPSRIPVRAIYLGTALNLAIGQGEILTTPVFLAVLAGLVGNKGWVVLPRFSEYEKPETLRLYAPDWAYDAVKRGMLKVIEEGTAQSSKVPWLKFGGKTGTAQNPHGEDHSLFIAFAPYDDPQIAIAVVVENAGAGSAKAAPIASEIIKRLFPGDLKITNAQTFNNIVSFNFLR
jgi:penicillin-binding protein 2